MENLKPILCVGLACVDLVTVVEKYPVEDTDMRSVHQYKVSKKHWMCANVWIFQVRGGNANNSCNVLSRLGFPASFLGTLADTPESEWMLQSMKNDGVTVENCPTYPDQITPNSVVITNKNTGSRTIIHTNMGNW